MGEHARAVSLCALSAACSRGLCSVAPRCCWLLQLHKNFPLLTNLPVLPPKKMFGNLDPRFVEKRRQELEAYLTALVEHQGAPGMVGIIPGTQGNLLQASQDLKAFVPQGYLKSVTSAAPRARACLDRARMLLT